MKRILPLLFLLIFSFFFLFSPVVVHAADQPPSGQWVIDPEVTFIGKNAARSGLFLDWTLRNYNWVCVQKVTDPNSSGGFVCDDSKNPIEQYWSLIMVYIVVPLLFTVLLGSAIVIIVTRGRGLTIMRFIPRFISVIVLIVFSYAIVQFLLQFTDLIQGFFLRSKDIACPPDCISQKDLLYVGWDYSTFVGLRLIGDYFAESAFISLLFTKLTALTYFVMVFVLLMRKIILWFFIIVSPVFPILLMYSPTRNTGKIWVGEFFRWLLYAPLFAIFLKGLVFLWRNQIPLVFSNPDIGKADKIVFPTAVNILLGGPKEFVTPANSVNLIETFAKYAVALIMLWTVILLPWILLQIFLEYAASFASDNNAVMRTMVNVLTKQSAKSGGGGPTPIGPTSSGMALNLPFTKKFSIPKSVQLPTQLAGAAKEIPISVTKEVSTNAKASHVNAVNAQTLAVANVTVPKLRDIAQFETKLASRNSAQREEALGVIKNLAKIANPASVTNTVERERVQSIRDRLLQQKGQGNVLASAVLSAATSAASISERSSSRISKEQFKSVLGQMANPDLAKSTINREKMSKLNEILKQESQQNHNQLASSILGINEKTSSSEMEKITDTLTHSKDDKLASQIMSVVTSTAQQEKTAETTKSVLQEIANPSGVTNVVERTKLEEVHTTLQNASNAGNELATALLSVNEKTSTVEVQNLTERLVQSQDDKTMAQVMNVVNVAVSQQKQTEQPAAYSTTQVKSVFQEVANPSGAASVTSLGKFKDIHSALQKESASGNELATALLSVNEKTSAPQIASLEQKLAAAKEQGVPFAKEIAALAEAAPAAGVPAVNKIQTVSKEDYQAVKTTWQENYKNLDVPEGMVGTRTDWIKDDIEKTDLAISLMSSTDQGKINQGLEQVSDILPFLLVGGFSQTEILSYLKAKSEAGKETLQAINKEEEDKIVVNRSTATHAAQTMAVAEDESSGNTGKPLGAQQLRPAATDMSVGAVKPPESQGGSLSDSGQANPGEAAPEAEPRDVLAEQDAAEAKLVSETAVKDVEKADSK